MSGNTAATALPAAAGNGGGIFSLSSVFLNNVTVTNNSADIAGGVAGITAEFANTVIAGNHAPRAPECRFTEGARSLGYNVVGDGTECLLHGGPAPGDIIGTADTPVDPRLGPLAANGGATETHAPLANSLLLDGGTAVRWVRHRHRHLRSRPAATRVPRRISAASPVHRTATETAHSRATSVRSRRQ